MTNSNSTITIRPAVLQDEKFILSMIPRLTEFGPPAWRDIDAMTDFDSQIILATLHHQSEDAIIYIAEDDTQRPLGLIHLFIGNDYYNKEVHGHISDLIVSSEGEGRGIGRMLLHKGEEWARSRGFRWLTLSVFAQNQRARELYERMGYGEDMVKYVKRMD